MALERERGALAVGVAVFLAGAVLLGLEIAASRVLAPYFGNSLFVWGALIGVVLAGLSIGYYAGGTVADRLPTPRLLVGVIGLSALLVLVIPFVDERVLERVVEWDPGPRASPLVAAIALFGLPSIVLGSVSPIAVRLSASSLERLGRTAGSLYALSTAGSIAGTFLTAFWLIPELGTDQVIAVGALGLLAAPGRGRAAPDGRARRRARADRPRRRRRRLARPEDGGRLTGAAAQELVAALSPARGSGRSGRRRGVRPGLRVRRPGREGHALPPHGRRRGRRRPATCASTARSRARCTSTIPTRRASGTPTT